MYNNELKHYGVLGMKWGVRRYQNKDGSLTNAGRQRYRRNVARSLITAQSKRHTAFQNKLSAISEGNDVYGTDKNRINYRRQNLARRLGIPVIGQVTCTLVNDMLAGELSKDTYKNKKQLIKRLKNIGAISFSDFAKNELLAYSVASKYNDDGTKKNSSYPTVTREDRIDMVVSVGTNLYSGREIFFETINFVAKQRARNEARFNRWGGHILSEKVDNIVWQSPDQSMSIIDNRGR